MFTETVPPVGSATSEEFVWEPLVSIDLSDEPETYGPFGTYEEAQKSAIEYFAPRGGGRFRIHKEIIVESTQG